jgi:hypothetical protein
MVANANDAFTSFTPSVGDSEETVKTSLLHSYPISGNLPMYGEISLPGLSSFSTTVLNITALRSIARVDVKKKIYQIHPLVLQ